MRMTESNVSRIAAFVYTGVSGAAAIIFLAVTLTGDYDWVARAGGALWVFFLTLIISMPTVIPMLRERVRGAS